MIVLVLEFLRCQFFEGYNSLYMENRLKTSLEGNCQVEPGSRLLVGVSGGPDSICLLHSLCRLNYEIVVAHLDHQLRPESTEDAEYVQEFAVSKNLTFTSSKVDTLAYAQSHALSIEEAARELRYNFLFQQAKEFKVKAVLVAHTADDQIETVLMHLLRGSGLAGLGGMPWRRITPWNDDIPLVRPFLGMWRKEVLDYCEQNDLQPRFDLSNLDTIHFRNRLRHELIPFLQSYNPNIQRLLWQMVQTLQADREVLESVTEIAWKDCLAEQGEGHVGLWLNLFLEFPLGLQRGLIRRAIAQLRPGLRDIGFDAVEKTLSFIQSPPASRQADLVAGVRCMIEPDRILLADWLDQGLNPDWPQMLGEETDLPLTKELDIGRGWVFHAEPLAVGDQFNEEIYCNRDPFIAYIDADTLFSEISIRTRKPADRFSPLGMDGGSLKLADFMINEKLPRRARKNWPLICAGEQIVWVPGFRIGHQFRVRTDSKKIIQIRLSKRME